MAKILNEQKSTAGSPYVFYSVWATEVSDSRTADSVQLDIQGASHLQYASSTLGTGSGYSLTGYLNINGTEYSLPLKLSNESWSGTTTHSTDVKRITITNLNAESTSLTNVKFRVARGTGSSSSAGYLSSTSCSNITISIGHTLPSDITMTMVETNASLTGVSNDVIVENLSKKQLTFTYTLHDTEPPISAIFDKAGVLNNTTSYSSSLNPFILDLAQITLEKDINDPTKIPLTPFIKDSVSTGYATTIKYSYIPYTQILITESITNAKRLGQTSGRVGLNINGLFFNGVVGNTDQSSSYKPTIKYKYWKVGDTEPVSYANTISSSNITITDNTFSVTSLDIGSSTETDPNYFNPNYAYRIKVQVSDNFTTSESNELQIQVGEAIWTEYQDRVDFKKLSIVGNIVNDSIIEEGGTFATNYYIKYASGLMIQYGQVEVSDAIQTAMGNVYRTANVVQHNLTENFIDTDYIVTLTANPAINSAYIGLKAVDNFTIWPICYNSTSAYTRYVDFIAIGKWK